MGITKSKQLLLTTYELQEFADSANLQLDDVQYLYRIFQNISSSLKDDGVIDINEFHNSLQNKSQDVSQLFFSHIDLNGDKVLNFREFVLGFSVFLSSNRSTQIKFLFKLLDRNNKNIITQDSIVNILNCLLTNFPDIQLSKEEVEQLVVQEIQSIQLNKHQLQSQMECQSPRKNIGSQQQQELDDKSLNYRMFYTLMNNNGYILDWLTIPKTILR